MESIPVLDGLTETAPDTATMTSRLVDVITSRPGRAQDDLESGITMLERAYSREPDKRLKATLRRALSVLRHGSQGDDSSEDDE